MSNIFKRKTPLILFLLPSFLFMIVFMYYPFIMNIINSFYLISGLGAPAIWLQDPVFTNYIRLFEDPSMIAAVKNSLLMMLLTIFIQVGIALVLALMISFIKKGAQLFRTMYFFPIVISATAIGLLFNLIFLYDKGMINQLISQFDASRELIDWKDSDHFFLTMSLPIIWQYIGFYFVILVTGVNNISNELNEAAAIDGANGFRRVRYITLPLLRNVLVVCVTLAITGSFKTFDLPWVMFPGGMPLDQSWLTGTYMYGVVFLKNNVSYGSTIAIAIVVMGVVLSHLASKIFKEADD